MAEIDILLATYNGEKFIAEQLDSLIAQTFKDFRVIIRDDGSNDNTPAIIQDYAEKYPCIIEVIHDDVICRSPTKNFFELMKHATADHIMFCDQDDVWLPYKIQITLDYMKKTERENPGKPALVFTGLELVDENLKSMDKFMALEIEKSEYNSLTSLILSGRVSGCAEMLNRVAYEHIVADGGSWILHDFWSSLYTAAFGVICHVPMALILYRQHKNNIVGCSKIKRSLMSKIFGGITKPAYSKGVSFREKYLDIMPKEKLQELDNFISFLNRNRFSRFFMLVTGRYPLSGSKYLKLKTFIKYVFF